MTHRRGNTSLSSLGLEDALAGLIASTRSKQRPLSLPEVANRLEIAVSALGSVRAVAEHIGLSPKMLRQFARVEMLSPSVRELFAERILDSVDAAVHLAMLKSEDQEIVARAIASGDLDTSDLRGIVQQRKVSPRQSIKRLVEKVQESKTKRRYVVEFVVRGTRTRRQLLELFRKHFTQAGVLDVEIDGPLGRLSLSRGGRDELRRLARDRSVSASDLITEVLSAVESP